MGTNSRVAAIGYHINNNRAFVTVVRFSRKTGQNTVKNYHPSRRLAPLVVKTAQARREAGRGSVIPDDLGWVLTRV